MAEKLIRLPQLQRFKQNADTTYQGKLTAGSNITISGNVISAQTFGQQTLYNATIPASGWSGTSNTVTIQGVAAGDDVEIVGINPTGMTSAAILAAKEALSLITYGTTSTNAIIFYALGDVPSVDIPVTIRKLIDNQVTVATPYCSPNIITDGQASQSIANDTLTELANVTLQPGCYNILFTCNFADNGTGYRQCGFSTNTSDPSGFGIAWMDIRNAVSGTTTQTVVSGPFEVSATSYPNGRKFYFLARQTSGSALTVKPRCYYMRIS